MTAVLKYSKEISVRSEIHYQQLVENMGDVVFTTDLNGYFTFISAQAKDVLHYAAENMVGRNIREFLALDSLSIFEENCDRQIQGKTLHPFEIEFVSAKGRQIPVEINTSPLFNTEGQLIGLEGIARNMSEHNRLEAELFQAKKMEAVGTLAAGVAHDFNNILQVIFSFTDLLLVRKNEDDPDHKKLTQIKKQVIHASELTRQLLTFSRKGERQLQPLNMSNEIQKLNEIIIRTIPKMVDVKLHLTETLKLVKADPNQIEQIIMNLVINARDAMPDGGELILRTEDAILDGKYCQKNPETVPGDYVLMTVSDTGMGMDKHMLENIFDPFYTTKEIGKGTGLGLSTVHGIVKNHDGYIRCESVPGQGTTFMIYLPVLKVEDRTEKVRDTLKEEIIGGSENIMMVDDEETVLEPIKEFLELYGYNVMAVTTGEEAITEVVKRKSEGKTNFDLIILDLNMPGMGGAKCLQRLLQIEQDSKVLIATGYADQIHEKKIRDMGARGFVSKPYALRHMLRKVRETLDEKSNTTQLLNYSTN